MAPGVAERLFYFIFRNFQQKGNFTGIRFALILLLQLCISLVDLVDRSDFIQRQTHNS